MFRYLSYVGIVVEDAGQAAARWCEVFGLAVTNEVVSEVEGVRSVFVGVPGAGPEAARLEFVEPLDKSDTEHPVSRRLGAGEGVLQLAFAVDDPEATDVLSKAGVRVRVAPPYSADTGPRAIVAPKSANGVLLELVADDEAAVS